MISPEGDKKIDEILTHYPVKRSAVIPALWVVQDEVGWISLDAMRYVAAKCEMYPEQVREVVTFYSMFNDRPMGKFHLQVCCTTPCMLNGSDEMIAYFETKLGIRRGETTPDGMFSLSQVECLGSCNTAPMLQVNKEKFDENLTNERADELIERLRARAEGKA
jgi:NADH-quinone oxidoreductase subunit E